MSPCRWVSCRLWLFSAAERLACAGAQLWPLRPESVCLSPSFLDWFPSPIVEQERKFMCGAERIFRPKSASENENGKYRIFARAPLLCAHVCARERVCVCGRGCECVRACECMRDEVKGGQSGTQVGSKRVFFLYIFAPQFSSKIHAESRAEERGEATRKNATETDVDDVCKNYLIVGARATGDGRQREKRIEKATRKHWAAEITCRHAHCVFTWNKGKENRNKKRIYPFRTHIVEVDVYSMNFDIQLLEHKMGNLVKTLFIVA